MNKGILVLVAIACLGNVAVEAASPKGDVFKGKLFPPNIILENQAQLELSEQQSADIKAAVVKVRANVAEHEWDLREAYQSIMGNLFSYRWSHR